jgi:hypothetical protein
MVDSNLHRIGKCRCGQIQFEVESEPIMTMACHCKGCQRMSASAFSLSALHPTDGFKITLGEPVMGGTHGTTRHYFCAYCMSWLFTRPEGMDEFVNIRVTMMDDAQFFSPFIETYTDEKLSWATTPAVHSFEKFPPPESFPALLSEFAEQHNPMRGY